MGPDKREYSSNPFPYSSGRGVKLVREIESNIGFNAAAVNANPAVYAEILPRLQPIKNAAGQITSYRVDPTSGSILIGDGIDHSVYHSMHENQHKTRGMRSRRSAASQSRARTAGRRVERFAYWASTGEQGAT